MSENNTQIKASLGRNTIFGDYITHHHPFCQGRQVNQLIQTLGMGAL